MLSSVVLFCTLSSILLQAISHRDVKNKNQSPVYNVPTFFLINFLFFIIVHGQFVIYCANKLKQNPF